MRANALQILKENYRHSNQSVTFVVWLQAEAENDPGFFRWLFEDDTLSDFSSGDHSDEWQQFLSEIIRNIISVTFYKGDTKLPFVCQISKSKEHDFSCWLGATTDTYETYRFENDSTTLKVHFRHDTIDMKMVQFINDSFL